MPTDAGWTSPGPAKAFRHFPPLKDGWYPFAFALLFVFQLVLSPSAQGVDLPLQQCGLGSLECAAYSPDERYIATGGTTGAVLWNAETGSVIRIFSGHTQRVGSIAFSPDGTKILTGGGLLGDATAKLWDVATGRLLQTFSGHSLYLSSVAFSPDGTKIITGGADNTAKIWDVANGTVIRTLTHAFPVQSAVFSPGGTKALTGSYEGNAKIWDAATGTVIRTISGPPGGSVKAIFGPDGTNVLTLSSNGAQLWDEATGALI